MVKSKFGKVSFSGKEEDFAFFADQFEAKMYLMKLKNLLLDEVTIVQADPGDEAAVRRQDKVEEELKELRWQVWCELIQCLQRETGMLIRVCKGDGTKAWKVLNEHFRSAERPRVQHLLQSLTNLKLMPGESVTDYLIRAEDIKLNLGEVGEPVSDQMMCSVVLKGLTKEYDSFVTVVNYGSVVKEFANIKRDLINYASDRMKECGENVTALFGGHSGTEMRCFLCKQIGHKKTDCPQKTQIVCHKCNKKGHIAKYCHEQITCSNCGKVGHTKDICYASGGGACKNDTSHFSGGKSSTNCMDAFSFVASSSDDTVTNCEFVIDSGCTGYMIKDKHLFAKLDTDAYGSVNNANKSTSEICGVGTASFWATDSRGQRRHIELKDAYYMPSYGRNLISVKRLITAGVEIIFGRNPRMEINNTIFPLCDNKGIYILTGQSEYCGSNAAYAAETHVKSQESKDEHAMPRVPERCSVCANGNKEVYDPAFVNDTIYNLHSVRRERGIDSETIGQYTTEHNVDTVESLINAGECVRSPDGLNAVGNVVVQEEESSVNMTETDDTSTLELMYNTDGVSDYKSDCSGISGIDAVQGNTSGIWDDDVFPESTDEALSDPCGNSDITKGDTQDLMEFSGYASDKCVQRSNVTIIKYDGLMGSQNGLSATKGPNTEYAAHILAGLCIIRE